MCMPFLFSYLVHIKIDRTLPRAWITHSFQHPVKRDLPVDPHFLVRPRLLTRL